jgi:hypothetical protein
MHTPSPDATHRATARWRLLPWAGAALLLALPWVAMHAGAEVRWTAFDFAGGGVLLFGLAALVDLALFRRADLAWRAGLLVASLTGFLLLWGTLAVGLIHDEGHAANLAVAGVLAIAALGAAWARGRAGRLGRVMVATAIAQAAAGGLAWSLGDPPGALVAAGFTACWSLSAFLFRRSAARQAGAGAAAAQSV